MKECETMKSPRIAKLSQQQKKILYKLVQETGEVWVHKLSRELAEEKEEVNDLRELRKENLRKVREADDEEEKRGYELAVKINDMMIRSRRHKTVRVTRSHSASFSRSLKRLEERGLIERYNGSGWHEEYGGIVNYLRGSEDDKTVYVGLTEEGEKVAKEIERKVEDDRYNLQLNKL